MTLNQYNLAHAVTVLVDAVHPGDDRWSAAYDLFFDKAKNEGTIDMAIEAVFDYLEFPTEEQRDDAYNQFWGAFLPTKNRHRIKFNTAFSKKQREAKGQPRKHNRKGSK
jgi:hypothetical protein